jgi:hypothetical protein
MTTEQIKLIISGDATGATTALKGVGQAANTFADGTIGHFGRVVGSVLNLRNAVTNFEPQWTCWDPDARDKWVREIPLDATTHYDWFVDRMEFEEFMVEFGFWYTRENKEKWYEINKLLYPYDVDANLHPDFEGIQIPETIHTLFRSEVEDIVYSIAGYDDDIREAGAEQFIRESFEEVGYKLKEKNVEHCFSRFTTPGYSTERVHYFLAIAKKI